jgi:hypothetical protein
VSFAGGWAAFRRYNNWDKIQILDLAISRLKLNIYNQKRSMDNLSTTHGDQFDELHIEYKVKIIKLF